jgi:uncharacterized protein
MEVTVIKRSIVHVEIPAWNREATAKFYADLFGWEFQQMAEPNTQSKSINVGYADIGDKYRSGEVLVYISSDDIQADLKKIESSGGKVVAPGIDVGEVGTMAIFVDPSGNRMALWKENERQG